MALRQWQTKTCLRDVSILQLQLARDAERAFFNTRVMCRDKNHKLLTFVIVIQPLLWLQGIDRLKWFNNHIGIGGVGVAGKELRHTF